VHVLLIDDDSIVRMVMSATLEEMGHDVTALESALDASEILALEQPDIVIVDHQMPDLTGEDWLYNVAAAELEEKSVFVILSGAEVDELERLVRDTCAVAYIQKAGGTQDFAAAFEKITSELPA
jgi:CheY-like chemotaxis protein